jgi:hypothetical protein
VTVAMLPDTAIRSSSPTSWSCFFIMAAAD